MLKLRIISPEKILFEGDVKSVYVPGELGEFEILDNHAPIISTLIKGDVKYSVEGKEETLYIQGGFVEVLNNVIHLCIEA